MRLLALADPVVGVVLVTTAFAGFVLAAISGRGKRDPAENNACHDERENYEPSEPFHCSLRSSVFLMAAGTCFMRSDYRWGYPACHH